MSFTNFQMFVILILGYLLYKEYNKSNYTFNPLVDPLYYFSRPIYRTRPHFRSRHR